MKRNLLFIICICFCLSCKKEKIENIEKIEKIEVKKTTVVLDTIPKERFLENRPSEDKMLTYLKSKYEAVYKFKDSFDEEMSLQFLGIKNIDQNSIDFHLYTETLPCDTEYYGRAVAIKNDTLSKAAENSLDETTFVKEEKEYKVYIILNRNKNEAKISYVDKLNKVTDCFPIVDTFMDLIKN